VKTARLAIGPLNVKGRTNADFTTGVTPPVGGPRRDC